MIYLPFTRYIGARLSRRVQKRKKNARRIILTVPFSLVLVSSTHTNSSIVVSIGLMKFLSRPDDPNDQASALAIAPPLLTLTPFWWMVELEQTILNL